MKFILLSILVSFFHIVVWAEVPLNGKSTGIVHIEHPEHIPHHPTSKDPTEQGSHDGIIFPRKRTRRDIEELI